MSAHSSPLFNKGTQLVHFERPRRMHVERWQVYTTSFGGGLLLAFYLWRNWQFFNLFVWRMVKRLRRLVTGLSEIERICRIDGISDAKQTKLFWTALSNSKDLAQVHRKLQTSNFDVDHVVSEIIATKLRNPNQQVRLTLAKCVRNIKQVSLFTQSVEKKSDVPFKRDDQSHEDQLEKLWSLMKPGVEREKGRYTLEWGAIGFQGQDPATDFRGGGILSLQQLLFFAETRGDSARRMLREPSKEVARYPWACCGIQITDNVVRFLKERMFDMQLYGRDEDACMRIFNDAYADLFEFFHARWVAADPANVLDYPNVFKKAIADAKSSIVETGEVPRISAN